MPVIDVTALEPKTGSFYPPPHDEGMGRYKAWPLSGAAGLTQFGAYLEELAPGGISSQRHWHEAEDEFLYMLNGELVLIEDDGEHILRPGDAAGWKAGDPNGHQLQNRGTDPASYLIVGTRAARDVCHYSDIDMICVTENGSGRFTRRDGTPL